MTDIATPDAGAEPQAQEPQPQGFTPIVTQEDLNRVLADRLTRERAKFADHAALKAKAARLDQLEEANKTELQKLTDARQAALQEAAAAKTELLRSQIALKHGITAEDAALFLTGGDEVALTAQAARLKERLTGQKLVVSSEGKPTNPGPDEMRSLARNLFGQAK